jgi:hypothetical protein
MRRFHRSSRQFCRLIPPSGDPEICAEIYRDALNRRYGSRSASGPITYFKVEPVGLGPAETSGLQGACAGGDHPFLDVLIDLTPNRGQ